MIRNYVLADVVTKSRIFFSGSYGICICCNTFDDRYALTKPPTMASKN
jgi:hypothetical protein